MAPDFGVRTGVVLNARRQPYGTINVSRPLERVLGAGRWSTDPGPDGRLGSADDGGTVTAYNLTAEGFGVPPVNLTTNLPDSNSDYYTWEITATKRQTARWSLLASFTQTWSREAALGTGNRLHAECADQRRGRSGSVQDVAGETERHDRPALGLSRRSRRPASVRHAVRAHLRPDAQLRQRGDQITGPRILRIGARLDW